MIGSSIHSGEMWLPVPDCPFYEVSDLGGVRSVHRFVLRKDYRNGKTSYIETRGSSLKGTSLKSNDGYREVYIAGKRALVHRLVLMAFIGPCPQGMEGCHYDGDRTNNTLKNLRWDTKAANIADSKRLGTYRYPPVHLGAEHHGAILCEDDVIAIRKSPVGTRGLTNKFGISAANIYKIRKRLIWKHVQ